MQTKHSHLLPLLTALLCAFPLFAYTDEQVGVVTLFGLVLIGPLLLYLVILFFFLRSQRALAYAMQTSHSDVNTGGIWIWTQLIPIWSFVATPVTLVKLSEQFSLYMHENRSNSHNIKPYKSTFGWVWYAGTIGSLLFDFMGIVALIGFIGYWVHIHDVKKSLNAMQSAPDNDQTTVTS